MLLLVILSGGVAILLYLGKWRDAQNTNSEGVQGRSAAQVERHWTSSNSLAGGGSIAADKISIPPLEAATNERVRQMEASVEAKNIPVNFWGRVVDQDGSPLSKVRVVVSVRQWFVTPLLDFSARFPETETSTDASGNFHILGGHGDSLTIRVLSKEHYEIEPMALRSFGFNVSTNITPDPSNPVLFRMWRNDQKEDLVTGAKFPTVIPDGKVHTLNVLTGTVDPTDGIGDLRFWIKRTEGVKFGVRHDWSCGIEVVGGGLVEEKEPAASMYLAPTNGYSERFQFDRNQSDERWSDSTGVRRFYTRSRSGKVFSRIEIEVYSVYGPGKSESRIRIKYAANPSGARILR